MIAHQDRYILDNRWVREYCTQQETGDSLTVQDNASRDEIAVSLARVYGDEIHTYVMIINKTEAINLFNKLDK